MRLRRCAVLITLPVAALGFATALELPHGARADIQPYTGTTLTSDTSTTVTPVPSGPAPTVIRPPKGRPYCNSYYGGVSPQGNVSFGVGANCRYVVGFAFQNRCRPPGLGTGVPWMRLRGTRFSYTGHGIVVQGRFTDRRDGVGSASVRRGGCSSGTLHFEFGLTG